MLAFTVGLPAPSCTKPRGPARPRGGSDQDVDRPQPPLAFEHGHRPFPSIVLDCSDPLALATFYGTMLDWKVDTANFDESDGWIDVKADYGQCLSFQGSRTTRPPVAGPGRAQQMHLDVVVDDLDTAEAEVVALGATKHAHQPGTTFRVMLDPAGHPFCLCTS